MTGLEIFLTILFSFILIALTFWVGRFFTGGVSRRWNRHKAETVDQWQAEGIEFRRGPVGGQFGGLESMESKNVVTGIGFVVLTQKDLRVTHAPSFGVWLIPYKQIKGVTLQPAFMGKQSKKTPFIVVRFKQGGKSDKIGFQVREPEAWAEELGRYARVSVKDLREENKT